MQREPHRNGNGSHPEHHAEHVATLTKHLEELKKAEKNSRAPGTRCEALSRANGCSAGGHSAAYSGTGTPRRTVQGVCKPVLDRLEWQKLTLKSKLWVQATHIYFIG